jgi:lysophospholipase L1-like esterase
MPAAPRTGSILLLLALALAAAALVVGLAAVHQWRASRLALLEPAPQALRARPAAPDPDAPGGSGGLLLLGDSRVSDWSPLPDRPYPVVRIGYPGESAVRIAPGFAALLDRHKPQAVLLMLGVNDAVAAAVAAPDSRAAARASSLAAFADMAQAARARSIPLTIALVIPPDRPDPLRRFLWQGDAVEQADRLNAALPAVAAAHGATLVDARALLAAPGEPLPRPLRADPLHFTPQAYQRLAALLPTSLAPVTPG